MFDEIKNIILKLKNDMLPSILQEESRGKNGWRCHRVDWNILHRPKNWYVLESYAGNWSGVHLHSDPTGKLSGKPKAVLFGLFVRPTTNNIPKL